MYLIDNIRNIRKLSKLTQSEFANKLGIGRTVLSNIEIGVTKPDIDIISKIAQFHGISMDDLYNLEISYDAIPKKQARTKKIINLIKEPAIKYEKGIPLIPISAMAGFANGDTQVIDYEIIENYVIPEFLEKGVKYLIRVGGSSMYPKYSNGDLLACRPVHDLSFFQWGKVYVLDTDQGPLVKRLFQFKEDKDLIECRSDNHQNYPPFQIAKTSIRKISIVVGVIRIE